MDEPKNVTLRVTEQGSVRVNAAHVHREAPGIACIYVDLHSKRVEPPMVGGGDSEPPVLYFTAGKHALHLDESKPRDSMTIVEFPEYVGWHVFACDGPARYTLGVVLVASLDCNQALGRSVQMGPLEHGNCRGLQMARDAADSARYEGLRGMYPAACVVLDMHVARLEHAIRGMLATWDSESNVSPHDRIAELRDVLNAHNVALTGRAK